MRFAGFRNTALGVTNRLRIESFTVRVDDGGGGGGGGILFFFVGLFLRAIFLLGDILVLPDEVCGLTWATKQSSELLPVPFSFRKVGCFDSDSLFKLSC